MRHVALLLLSFTLCVGVARGDDGPLSAAKQARVDEAERIEVQARDRLRAGDVDAAEAKALEAVDIKERALGRKHPGVASALETLAAVHMARAQDDSGWAAFAPALTLYRRAEALRRGAPGVPDEREVPGLTERARIAGILRDASRASGLYERAFVILERHRDPSHPQVLECLDLAIEWNLRVPPLARDAEHSARLVRHAQRLADGIESAHAADEVSVARALHLLGRATFERAADMDLARTALARAQEILGPHPAVDAETRMALHFDLARLSFELGDLDPFRLHLDVGRRLWAEKNAGRFPYDDPDPWRYEWIPGEEALGDLARLVEARKSLPPESDALLDALRTYLTAEEWPTAARSPGRAMRRTLGLPVRLGEAILEARKSTHGVKSLEVADALEGLAQALLRNHQRDEAIAAMEQCVQIRTSKSGRKAASLADAHAALGYLLCCDGRFEDAVPQYEQAVRIRAARRTEQDALEALRARLNVAWLHEVLNAWDDVHTDLDAIMKSLRSDPRLPNAFRAAMAERMSALRRSATRPADTGDRLLVAVRTLCDAAERPEDAAWLRTGWPGQDEFLQETNEHACALGRARVRGDYQEALRLARDYFEHNSTARVRVGPLTGLTRWEWDRVLHVAELLALLGAYEEGLAVLQPTLNGLVERRASGSGGSTDRQFYVPAIVARTLLARLMLARGLPDEAHGLAAQALELYTNRGEIRLPAGNFLPGAITLSRASTAFTIARLASVLRPLAVETPEVCAQILHALGRTSEAIRAMEDQLEILESHLAPGHTRLVPTLALVSRLYLARDEPGPARVAAERALRIVRERMGAGHPAAVDPLIALGDADLLEKRYDRALHSYRQVAKIAKARLYDGHLSVPLAKSGMALALARSGRVQDALKPMREALDLVGERARALLGGATCNERLGLVASVLWALGNWLEVTRLAEVDGYDEVLRHKGLVARAMGIERRTYRQAEGDARKVYDDLIAAQRRLARLAYLAPHRRWRRLAWRKDVAAAAAECKALERALARVHRSFRAVPKRLEMKLEAVQASLERGEALVDVLHAGECYTAWIVGPGSEPKRVALGPVEELDTVVEAFRDAVRSAPSEEDPAFQDTGAQLRQALWVPVEAALPEGTQTIYLVPDGAIAAAPLGALPGRVPGRVVADEYALAYLASAQQIVPWRPRPTPGRGLLTMGDVDFDALIETEPALTGTVKTLADLPGGTGRFGRLPGTTVEVVEVTSAYAATKRGDATSLTQVDATERRLREGVSGREIIHLATHGYVRPWLDSSLKVRQGDVFRLRAGLELHAQRFDPFLMSGLALAGANQRQHEDDDDGILTSLEAMTLDLDGVALVVLSACDTASGVQQAGDGVLGLVRAVSLAGARNVVASLWQVDDAGTLALMKQFYAAYLRKPGPAVADALHEACASLRSGEQGEGLRAPRHWSAFVAFGPMR